MAGGARAARRAATTRWCSARWCATTRTSTIRWGSRRAASASTSRSGANAYLYGTRFFTWLAYTYSPEKVVAWMRRDEGSKRYYADQFEHVFGLPLEQAWQDWIAFEHDFQRQQPRGGPQVPDHAAAQARRERARARSRACTTTRRPARSTARSAIPASSSTSARSNTRDGSVRRLADIKRAMLFRVTSFAYDPASGTLFYTNDNLALRDLMAVDVQDRRGADAARGRAHRRDRRSIPSTARCGACATTNGFATLVRIPASVRRVVVACTRFPTEYVPSDLDISPDGTLLSASMSEVNGDQFLRVWEIDEAPGRRREAAVRVPLRPVGPGELRVLARRPLPVRQQLLHRRVEHLPLRGRHRQGRGGVERRDRLLPARAARRRPARRAELHGEGFVPAIDRSAAARGRERDHVPRRGGRREVSRSSRRGRCRRRARSTTRSSSSARGRTCRCASLALANAYPGAAGLQELRRDRLSRQLRGSAQLREARHHRRLHAD